MSAVDPLAGQVALVTGASRGIGRSIALALAGDGALVAVNYRARRDAALAVVAEIEDAGGKAVAIRGDVADPAVAATVVARARTELGGLHILVNNAGIARDGLIYHLEPADWLAVMQNNFGSVFNCTRAAMEHFMAERAGAIVNVSSVMGERAWIGQSNYAASKAAIDAFTRCCALELARFRVRVNAVLPGFTPTELVGGLMARDAGRGIKRQIPWRDFATPEQVARVVAFLAGPGAAYMTGELVRIDGGASCGLGLGRPD
jgi:3-oxoacyl-[acyl-carrier protein] reductase